jgi:hypothetical protein
MTPCSSGSADAKADSASSIIQFFFGKDIRNTFGKAKLFSKTTFGKANHPFYFSISCSKSFMVPVDRYRLGSHPGRRRHLISYRPS